MVLWLSGEERGKDSVAIYKVGLAKGSGGSGRWPWACCLGASGHTSRQQVGGALSQRARPSGWRSGLGAD